MTLTPPTPTRRTLLRTTAWATPAVMVATGAPAFATSTEVFADCTVTHTIDWGALNEQGQPIYGAPPRVTDAVTTSKSWSVPAQQTVTGGTWDSRADLVPVSLTIGTAMLTNGGFLTQSDSAANGIGNGHFNYVELAQTATTTADQPLRVGKALKFGTAKSNAGASDMRITLGFSRAVKNLAFTITDIDSNGSNQLDHVWIESINEGTPSFTQQVTTVTSGQTRSFSGTGVNTAEANRWRGNAEAGNSSVRGNVRVTAAGPASGINTVTIRFGNYANNSSARTNTINIGNISFQTTDNICTI